MRKLIAQGYAIRRNWPAIIGVCLLCYFSYHALLGERSTVRLMKLERKTDEIAAVYEGLHTQRVVLEDRVVKLRPASIDRDMLEERVRYVLGYYRPGETVILN